MSWSTRQVRLTVLLGLGLVALVVGLYLGSSRSAVVQSVDALPSGRWHFQPSRLADSPSGDELARVLSLPYVSGGSSAPARDGVIHYLDELAFGGLNLRFGPRSRGHPCRHGRSQDPFLDPFIRRGFSRQGTDRGNTILSSGTPVPQWRPSRSLSRWWNGQAGPAIQTGMGL